MPAAGPRRHKPAWVAVRTCWTPALHGPRPRSPSRAHSRGARPPRHGRGRRALAAGGSARPRACQRSAAAPRASRAWPEPLWVSQPTRAPRRCPRWEKARVRGSAGRPAMPSNHSPQAAPAGAQRWEQPQARPGPSAAAGILARPPAGPGAMTGVVPAPGASARGGSTRRPPLALTHRGPGGAGLPASREGPRAGGARGARAAASSRLQRGRASCARRGWGAQQAQAWAQPGAGLLGLGRRQGRGGGRVRPAGIRSRFRHWLGQRGKGLGGPGAGGGAGDPGMRGGRGLEGAAQPRSPWETTQQGPRPAARP